MDLGLSKKSVLVMAASKGLGRAIAELYAEEGALVTIASRSMVELGQARDEITAKTGNRVHAVACDVTSNEQIEQAVAGAVAHGNGELHVVVTNAGGPPAGQFVDFEADEAWFRAFELNLMSVVRTVRSARPHLVKARGGRIVAVTSTSIKQPIDGLVLSNTMRTGVLGLVKSLASELAPSGVLCNIVAPGRIATDRLVALDELRADQMGASLEAVRTHVEGQIPLGRYGTPDEFARAAVFLGSFANTYVTGQALLIDGGMVRAL